VRGRRGCIVGHGAPLEVGHRTCGCSIVGTDVIVGSAFLIDGRLDACSEARDVIGLCGCWTCIVGTKLGGFYTNGSVGVMEREGCVGRFKSSRIAGCAVALLKLG